jgi:DNA invertase Pin-like site-specific DNA recombinase
MVAAGGGCSQPLDDPGKIICRKCRPVVACADLREGPVAILGYVRTLSDEESRVFDRHSQALTAVGCERVFGDRSSGSADERPSLTTCLAALRSGDVLVVVQLDHLGYRMEAVIRFVSDLADRCVGFRTLDTVFDTTTPAGRAFLQIQSALAEMERTLIRQRISGGIAAARARGRKGGRPRVMTAERLRHAQRLMADPSRSIPSICHELDGLPVSTLYHYLRADGSLKEPGRKLLDSGETGSVAPPVLSPAARLRAQALG